ncbi:MAG TPA: class I SAM-dependent methyltransferase [Candidatus Acidoferrales bacterium]|nr:class I SAM-dependent methyltransferase [Candidatus Acidoferrales bacterium]
MPRILDLGCGPGKYPGAIGADRLRQSAADVLCDFDRGRLPFAENSFDEVRAVHVIEHAEDPVRLVEEMHRVARPGGLLVIVTPHCSDASSYTDPTHRRHLNSFSFRFFYPGGVHGSDHFYSPVRLRERRLRIRLLRLWRWLGLEFLVNHSRAFRRFWEYYLCFVVRGKVMEFELEVLK